MNKLILCLANSYKYGGRCLAGIELVKNDNGYHIVRNIDGSPHWVRPVLPEGTGEIPADVTTGIDLFDLVEVENCEECPHYAHSEDVTFSSLSKIRNYPRTVSIIDKLCDNVHQSLLGFAEKKITPEQYCKGEVSLALISPSHVRIICSEVDNVAKFRAFFNYKGIEYNCSITDPTYLRLLESYGVESLERQHGEMYLVVSLSKEYNGYYHKLVAGVIDLAKDILQSATLIPAEILVKTPQQALKDYFGYDSFRPLQEEIIQHVLEGKDCLSLMPTGGGKSVCFQIPALMLEGVAIVVSPLIALMKDQVESLRGNGIAAVALNSMVDAPENYDIRKRLISGQIKLLYISPERLLMEINGLLQHIRVSLFAIDEAHCISQWGHDFRPEYTRLGELRDLFPDVPIAAFTATADKLTRKDIVEQLKLREPRTFIASFDRPNLSLDVRAGYSSEDKFRTILSLIDRHPGESGIIYCLARKTTEEIAQKLQAKGIKAEAYHAMLLPKVRSRIQDDFINDRITVICATIAFGMGIDKSNIRFIGHYNLPKNIESYYQEIGRGGRDGLPCETILFYNIADLVNLKKFCEDSGQKEVMLGKLECVRRYAESQVCRRRILLNYFNEPMDHDCCNCDVCKNPSVRFDGTILVQKALSVIARSKEQLTLKMTIMVLRGQNSLEIRNLQYDRLKSFGIGSDISFRDWNDYLFQMLQMGYIEIEYTEGNHLKITDQGRDVLYGKEKALLNVITREDLTVRSRKKRLAEMSKIVHESEEQSKALFEKLCQLRNQIAIKEQKAPHTVLSDRTLQRILAVHPITVVEMSQIVGFSKSKVLNYGQQFTQLVREYRNLSIVPDSIWDDIPEEMRPKPRTCLVCQGIRYDFAPELYSAFTWSDTFKELSKLRYWNLWKETRYKISDYVPVSCVMHDAVVDKFLEIIQHSLGFRIEGDHFIIPVRVEYDADGNPVSSLDCTFEEGMSLFISYLEKEHHFPFRRTSAFECSLLRWYHEISRGIIKLTKDQQIILDEMNEKYKDLPRFVRQSKTE